MKQRSEAIIASHRDQIYHAISDKEIPQLIAWMENKISPIVKWKGDSGIRIMHRSEDDRDIFLLGNPGLQDAEGELRINIRGAVSIWNADDGHIEAIEKRKADEAIQVMVPAESARFVVID